MLLPFAPDVRELAELTLEEIVPFVRRDGGGSPVLFGSLVCRAARDVGAPVDPIVHVRRDRFTEARVARVKVFPKFRPIGREVDPRQGIPSQSAGFARAAGRFY